ncbi:DUF6438 domain-containing protein [Herpetosiphon sp. NSE202]|uniref:DUF6438 domain-containing protein n=1 Tax=Herpetosiphon sp. NSE202 TaxID=3351349 RepID=UPI00362868B3
MLGLMGCGSQAVSKATPQPSAVPTRIQQVPADLEITIRRSMCYGTCPVYEVTIDHTGKVVYEGKDFVKIVGQAETNISNEQLLTLINAFVERNYWDYQASYNEGPECVGGSATDNPGAATSITMNGKSKAVWHYYGCRGFAGEDGLFALEKLIDTTVNVKQWTD